MLDDKYWMDIGGMKSLGGGGDFLPFRRLEASIRSASPNRVTRYTCCTGGWAIGQEDLVRVYRLNHRIRQFLQWKHTSASFLTSVHWLRDGRVYNFTLSLLRDSSTKERVHFEPGLFDSIAGNTYSFFFFSIHNYIKERNNFVDSIRVINILSL